MFSGVLSQGVHSSDTTIIGIRCTSSRTPFHGDFRSKCPIFIILALLKSRGFILRPIFVSLSELIMTVHGTGTKDKNLECDYPREGKCVMQGGKEYCRLEISPSWLH